MSLLFAVLSIFRQPNTIIALLHDSTSQRLGKIDYGSMSDQQLLELMIAGFNDKSKFADHEGDYKDACDWYGVRCNAEGAVEQISWPRYDIKLGRGNIDFEWLPPNVENLNFYEQHIGGNSECEVSAARYV